jgi:diketogulonate reductase-like aldo/keto reductase
VPVHRSERKPSQRPGRNRIAENAQISDFELAADDMQGLDALDRSGGTRAAMERNWW